MPVALQVCYYPIKFPVAGGQIRTTETSKLIAALGYDPSFLGIYPHRTDGWPGDFPLSKDADEWVFRWPHDFEMRVTTAVQSNKRLVEKILDRANYLNPGLIWLEHPFLWPIFRDWAMQRRDRMSVAYSSHNVEWQLKSNLLSRLNISDKYSVQRIYDVERDLAMNSDVIVCCSHSDGAIYSLFRPGKVLVVPNGSRNPELSGGAVTRTSEFALQQEDKAAVMAFVSSSHEPNWFGLRDLILPNMQPGTPLEHSSLILMGDICSLYKKWIESGHHHLRNVFCAGRVSDEEKSDYFRSSDIVILPILDGGGTNLKTAEALLSSRLIVATEMAFRGFEHHRNLPGVFCGPPGDFPHLLERANSLRIRLGTRERLAQFCRSRHHRVRDCEWPTIMSNAVPHLQSLLKDGLSRGLNSR